MLIQIAPEEQLEELISRLQIEESLRSKLTNEQKILYEIISNIKLENVSVIACVTLSCVTDTIPGSTK